jgi:biotin transport system substrate-specific component
MPALNARRTSWSPPIQAAAVAAGVVALAVASRLSVPLPDGAGVPVTLQTWALFVMAGLVGGRLALITVLAWLALAALGAPVLADGAGGWRAVTGLTLGFLVGMAAAAFVCGRACERTSGVLSRTLLFLAGHVIVLAMGWSGMISIMSPASAFEYGILPFIPGAVIKSVAAALTLRLFAR